MAMNQSHRGFALLVAVIFMTVMLSFGMMLGSLGYKQTILASSAVDSQYAFYAADAALECALYYDQQMKDLNPFVIGGDIYCNEKSYPITPILSGTNKVSTVLMSIGEGNKFCAQIDVYKPTVLGGTTYIFSQGYSTTCADVTTDGRYASRGLKAHY